jgi:hypothetical protein
VSECILFADWPQNREKDRERIAQLKSRKASGTEGGASPAVPMAHGHGHH